MGSCRPPAPQWPRLHLPPTSTVFLVHLNKFNTSTVFHFNKFNRFEASLLYRVGVGDEHHLIFDASFARCFALWRTSAKKLMFFSLHRKENRQNRMLKMFPKISFVRLSGTVQFKVFLQISGLWGCIVTLVAFVRLFSTMHFQMSPQTGCPWGCKVT